MSEKQSPSPQASTREARLRIVARSRRRAGELAVQQVLPWWEDQVFLEPEFDTGEGGQRSIGNMLLGFAVVAVISGSFWMGVGLLINRILK